jgi:hypothetical protein
MVLSNSISMRMIWGDKLMLHLHLLSHLSYHLVNKFFTIIRLQNARETSEGKYVKQSLSNCESFFILDWS